MTIGSLEIDSNAIHSFCKRWQISELCVFGSILRADFRKESDADFMADYDIEADWDLVDHIKMTRELAEIMGRPVDIVDRPAIEGSSNRYLRREILATAKQIHAA